MDKTADQIYTDVIAFLKASTGIPKVIRGDEDGTQPKGEYASVLIIDEDQIGLASRFYTTDASVEDYQLVEHVVASNVYIISVQVYRGTPRERVRKIGMWSQSSVGQLFFQDNDLVINNISNPIDTSYPIGAKTIKRFSFQMEVHACSKSEYVINQIEEAELVINSNETIILDTSRFGTFGFDNNGVGFDQAPFVN